MCNTFLIDKDNKQLLNVCNFMELNFDCPSPKKKLTKQINNKINSEINFSIFFFLAF